MRILRSALSQVRDIFAWGGAGIAMKQPGDEVFVVTCSRIGRTGDHAFDARNG